MHCQHANSYVKYHGKCLASTCRLRMVTACPQTGHSFLPNFGVLRVFFSATGPSILIVIVSPTLSAPDGACLPVRLLHACTPALPLAQSCSGIKVTVLLGGGDGEQVDFLSLLLCDPKSSALGSLQIHLGVMMAYELTDVLAYYLVKLSSVQPDDVYPGLLESSDHTETSLRWDVSVPSLLLISLFDCHLCSGFHPLMKSP